MIWVIFIFFGILSFAIQNRLKSKFKKYSQIQLQNGLTGAEIAKLMLTDNNIHDVKVTCIGGQLTDHYNPATKTVNLSEAVYHGNSAASAAVASHECGHAVQHATAYSWLGFRSALVPIQNVSAKILNIVVMASIFGGAFLFNSFPTQLVLLVIIGSYSVITLFSLVTLPVEFDASNRALAWVQQRNIVTSTEYGMAKDSLKWAAMTYVVAALASLVTLLYYVSLLLGSRD
ncbi:zinc metallopeptidase [Marinigracilibium pacificum]|uniref:Zinc metallopeptidase n=1 Tax=Marinigracilibium pacificum TaxID=2729599 RepID=A0A848IUS7_9BACT|nr:zinc metallopeptidase [Marinigracilibium pacificum]NMM47045.1 zinc metallopeptidase [Marinigracilibium pacificum]